MGVGRCEGKGAATRKNELIGSRDHRVQRRVVTTGFQDQFACSAGQAAADTGRAVGLVGADDHAAGQGQDVAVVHKGDRAVGLEGVDGLTASEDRPAAVVIRRGNRSQRIQGAPRV